MLQCRMLDSLHSCRDCNFRDVRDGEPMIYNAVLVLDLFDYLSMQCTEEANDLMTRMRDDIESNEVQPEDFNLEEITNETEIQVSDGSDGNLPGNVHIAVIPEIKPLEDFTNENDQRHC